MIFKHGQIITFLKKSLAFREENIFFYVILYLFGSLLIPGNKVFFVLSSLFLGVVFLITGSFAKVLIYTFLPFMLYSCVGQPYVFNVIPPELLKNHAYPDGKNIYFKLSPYLMLIFTMYFYSAWSWLKQWRTVKVPKQMLVLILLLVLLSISSFQSKWFPFISWLQVVESTGNVMWMFVMFFYFKTINKKAQNKILKIIIMTLACVIIFEGLISVAQVMKGEPLGLVTEQSNSLPNYGTGADESRIGVRPFGFQLHANNLAFRFVTMYTLFLFLWVWMAVKEKVVIDKRFLTLTTIMFLFTILLTQSRAAYLAVLFLFVGVMWKNPKIRVNVLIYSRNLLKKNYVFFWSVFFLALLMFSVRLANTFNSFAPNGGFEIRKLINVEAYYLISKNPWFGVGTYMFVPAAFFQHPDNQVRFKTLEMDNDQALDKNVKHKFNIMKSFPESVHNGFLNMIVECGFLAFGTAILFYILVIREVISSNLPVLIKSVVYFSLIANMTMIFFHPFSDIIRDIAVVLLVLINVNESVKK